LFFGIGMTPELGSFDAAERLHKVATRLITARGMEVLFEEIVDAAVAILKCDFANLQMLCPDRGTNGELRLLGHRGFNAETTESWEWVNPAMRTTCAETWRSGQQVPIVVVAADGQPDRYVVIDGRIAALQQLGRDKVEAVVWPMTKLRPSCWTVPCAYRNAKQRWMWSGSWLSWKQALRLEPG
jgi:hypothetical protein